MDIERDFNRRETVGLSQFGKRVEYIALESSPECVIGTINGLELCDSLVFVSDYDQLYVFSRNGKVLRKIGVKGNGPGEYSSTRFCVDRFNLTVQVNAGREMLIFDFNGNFIRKFEYGFPSAQHLVKDGGSIMLHEYNRPSSATEELNSWHIMDPTGNELVKYPNNQIRTQTPGFIVPYSPLYLFNGSIHFMEFGFDTLNYFYNEEIKPYAVFKAGKYKMEPDVNVSQGEEVKEKIWIYNARETKDFMLIDIGWGFGPTGTSVFDKRTGEFTILPEKKLVNDIDGGVDFWPKTVVNDAIMVGFVDAYDLLLHLNAPPTLEKEAQMAKSKQLMELKETLTENSNPIIMVVE